MTCVLGIFLLLASLLIIVPHVPTKPHSGIKPKAEYLVVLSYDDHRNVDLDLWLHHDDCTVYYNARECKNISLDRDSRGFLSNLSLDKDGMRSLSPNQEVISIRAVLPGDYLTAVNYYDQHAESVSPPIDCKVELIKLNPTVTIIQEVKLHLDQVKQTLNAIAFHVGSNGDVTIQPVPPEDLISLYGAS